MVDTDLSAVDTHLSSVDTHLSCHGGAPRSEPPVQVPNRIVLGLASWVQNRLTGSLAAAHELFHVARHVVGATPFPTRLYGNVRVGWEELLVWTLTFLYAPLSFLFGVAPIFVGLFLLAWGLGLWLLGL